MRFLIWPLLSVMTLAIAGCATDGAGDPAAVVEQYLQASIDADETALAQTICAEMEAEIEAAGRRFATVSGARLEGVACTFDADTETVACDGEIIATYGTEDTAFPLSSYRVVQEGGEWRWCGEAG